MRVSTSRSHTVPKPLPFPNAATPRDKLEKGVDLLLTFLICAGLVVSLMFLLTM